MEDDDDKPQSANEGKSRNHRSSNNVSTDGVSLPDMSISFCENDETGEMSAVAAEAEWRHQFDEDGGEDLSPQKVSADLDSQIKAYGRAIAEYEDLEETCIAELGPELASVIDELRSNPKAFETSTNPKIQTLARTRAQVFVSKKNLGISNDLNYDSTGRRRAKSFSSPVSSGLFSDESDIAERAPAAKVNKRASWQVGRAANGNRAFDTSEFARGPRDAQKPEAASAAGGEAPLSKMLSEKWAERLVDVNPTRGKLRESGVNEHGVQTFKIRPLWPEWLVDTNYNVIKRNKYGKRQKRIIRLTEHHFFNIKNGREITQSFVYSEMKNVWLKNQTTLIVGFGEDSVYEYETEIAPLIAQQLATRVQVRKALDRAAAGPSPADASVSALSKSTAALISSIESVAAAGGPSSIISFARTISETFLNEQEQTERGSSMWHRDTNGFVDDAALAQRLIHLIPDSPEMLISAAVQDIMFDVRAPEGNTRRVFIEKFLAYETSGPAAVDSRSMCTELRHFVDGMHEYIMEKRGASLAAIFVVASSGNSNRKLNFRVAKAYETDSGPDVAGRTSERLYQHPAIDESGAPWWKNHNELTILSLSYLIFTGVEQSVCITLQEKLVSALPSAVNKEEDVLLYQRMRYLKHRSQGEWDIPEPFRSPLNWESATFELAGIERNPTPSMKIYALLQCAKAIYSEFKNEILPRIIAENPGKTDVAIGADDFLPIFLYVLCHSSIDTPLRTKELLWGLCHPDQLYGESGYYLTVYESALEFIQQMEIDQEAMAAALEEDAFEEDSGRRTISVTTGDAAEMAAILSPAAQIKKKIRRMSVNVIERVTTRNNSVDTDVSAGGGGGRALSRGDSASSLASTSGKNTRSASVASPTATANPLIKNQTD